MPVVSLEIPKGKVVSRFRALKSYSHKDEAFQVVHATRDEDKNLYVLLIVEEIVEILFACPSGPDAAATCDMVGDACDRALSVQSLFD